MNFYTKVRIILVSRNYVFLVIRKLKLSNNLSSIINGFSYAVNQGNTMIVLSVS